MKFLAIIIILLTISGSSVYAQQPQLASYRETAHILVDEKIQNQTTAFITLTSTSPVEMRVPAVLSEKIHSASNVTSVVITNADNCILGVTDQICILVNIISPSLISTYNITAIQSTSRQIGDTLIDNINKAFGLNATFSNVYVNPKGLLNNALGTSGAVSGNRTISVVYTMPKEDSPYLYDGLTSILIPKQIRDDGGFYDAAKSMAQDNNSTVTFAITPGQQASIYQLQVSKHFPIKGKITSIKPLDLIGIDKLERSKYFSVGFFPLNSIFDIVVLSNDNISITDHGGALVPTTIQQGQQIPTDLTKAGWVFDPGFGQRINAIYLFGTTQSTTDANLTLTLGNNPAQNSLPTNTTNNEPITPKPSYDYSTLALIGIIIAGGAAVYLFIKRR